MTLGEQIKQKRDAMNISQEELAEKLNISRQSISKWETDLSVPTGENRRLLHEILGLDLSEYPDVLIKKKLTWAQKLITLSGWLVAVILLIALIYTNVANTNPTHTFEVKDSEQTVVLDGSDLDKAKYMNSDQGDMIVIKFNIESTKLLEKITQENLGKTLAIYIDGTKYQQAVVNEPITNGEIAITGVSQQKAQELTKYINASKYKE